MPIVQFPGRPPPVALKKNKKQTEKGFSNSCVIQGYLLYNRKHFILMFTMSSGFHLDTFLIEHLPLHIVCTGTYRKI